MLQPGLAPIFVRSKFGREAQKVKVEEAGGTEIVPAISRAEELRLNNKFHYAMTSQSQAFPWVQQHWDSICDGPGKNKKKVSR